MDNSANTDYVASDRYSASFDYDKLEDETRNVVKFHTESIKERIRRTAQDIVDIGEMLLDVKERLPHGQFSLWLQIEFGWDERTARRFMSVAAMLKTDNLSDLSKPLLDKTSIDQSALYLLAAKSTPQEVRREILERAYQGEPISHAKVKEVVTSLKKQNTAKAKKRLRGDNFKNAKSLYKKGVLVDIDCPKNAEYRFRKWNGCCGIVKDVGTLGIEVNLGAETIIFMTTDLNPIDNPSANFRNIAEQAIRLLERDDIDEVDQHLITTFYLRRKNFSQRQIELLTELAEHYEKSENS